MSTKKSPKFGHDDPGTFSVWLLLPMGMYAVSHRWPGSYDPEADDRDIQVRSRKKKYLDRLRNSYLPELGKDEGLAGEGTDYGHRAFVRSDHLARAMARMALNIDASGFKSHAADGDLHDAYMSCWSALVRLEDAGPYAAWKKPAAKTWQHIARPEDCARLGEHWWDHQGTATCRDCGAKRYYLPKTGTYRHRYPPGSVRIGGERHAAKQAA